MKRCEGCGINFRPKLPKQAYCHPCRSFVIPPFRPEAAKDRERRARKRQVRMGIVVAIEQAEPKEYQPAWRPPPIDKHGLMEFINELSEAMKGFSPHDL